MEVRVWVLLVSFLVLVQTLGITCCVREEREALLRIKAYLHTHYDGTLREKHLSSWVTDDPNSDCCRWNRVKCHPSSGRVSKLSLQDLSRLSHNDIFYGVDRPTNIAIDFSMFQNFKELTSLNFSNDFSDGYYGSLENTAVLGNLSNLEVLILRNNSLWGYLPLQDICKLKKIRVLDFSYNMFGGSLHKCLANLTSLQALDLGWNMLIGHIPAFTIASLTSLEYFSATKNNFTGLFPLSSFTNNSRLKVLSLQMDNNEFQVDTESSEAFPWVPLFQLEVLRLPNCTVKAHSRIIASFLLYQHDLYYLDLSNNDLVGEFPNWLLLNNTKLRSLILDHNKFTGTFEFPNNADQPFSHALITLQLSDNQMEGKLPTNIDLMFPNLENLYVSGNGLNGGIPPSIGNMSNLISLDLSRNKFSSQIPESLWAGCDSLVYLILSHNNLQGKLLPSHKNSSSLKLLLLDNNFLSGTLDHEIWHLPYLEVLDISNNNLWGMVPTFITKSSSLSFINLSRNNFTGTLPRELCKHNASFLHLSYNKLSGSIPACYFNIGLSSLQLRGNRLGGSIPTFMRPNNDLSVLDLSDNKLSRVIPDSIVKMKSLNSLLLGGNQLHGQLPNQLCQLKAIGFLDLSRNNFSGNIPTCFYNFSLGEQEDIITGYWTLPSSSYFYPTNFYYYSPLHLTLVFEENGISITIEELEIEFMTKNLVLPFKVDMLGLMSGIDLSSNKLTGKIPQEIGYLKSLHVLNLSNNHLNGSIPKSFHNFSAIESIDLSNNNLDGEIPIELLDLNFLVIFNVSYNNLSGRVPNGEQFSTFDDSCFKGNHYLIRNNNNKGNSIYTPATSLNNDTKEDESIIDFTSFIWSFSSCYVAVLVIMVTVLWINPYWRRMWFYYIETCLYRCFYPYLKDAFW